MWIVFEPCRSRECNDKLSSSDLIDWWFSWIYASSNCRDNPSISNCRRTTSSENTWRWMDCICWDSSALCLIAKSGLGFVLLSFAISLSQSFEAYSVLCCSSGTIRSSYGIPHMRALRKCIPGQVPTVGHALKHSKRAQHVFHDHGNSPVAFYQVFGSIAFVESMY